MRIDDCGEVTTGPIQGFKTANNLYIYGGGSGVINYSAGGIIASETIGAESNDGRDVTRYAVNPASGSLKIEGVYKFSKGGYSFEKAKVDGDTWTRLSIQKIEYRTSNFLPQTYWDQIPTFEASIDADVLARKKEGSEGGFQWGKALALGVGAVAGGGLSLDTDTQASIISGIVLDSMKDANGTSNLNEAVSVATQPTLGTSNGIQTSKSSSASGLLKPNLLAGKSSQCNSDPQASAMCQAANAYYENYIRVVNEGKHDPSEIYGAHQYAAQQALDFISNYQTTTGIDIRR